MADLNPFSGWKGFLALPNESRTKTIAVAFLVAAVCALAVNGATVVLRPIQAANRAHEQQVRLEALISAIPGMNDLIDQAGGDALSAVVVNLETGWAAKDVTPDTLETALQDPANYTQLTPEEDTRRYRLAARLRPDLHPAGTATTCRWPSCRSAAPAIRVRSRA